LAADGMQGAVIRIDDVTQQVKGEKLVEQSEKMQSIAGLAAGMAHEINNPLAAITQGLQNILRRLDPTRTKNIEFAADYDIDPVRMYELLEARKIISFIDGGRDAVVRAAAIVKNMLMFSRSSNSIIAPVMLNELIEHAIQLGATDYDMKKKYDFKFVEIIREFDPSLPPITCCSVEIEQVLLNLFKNALQAMEEIDDTAYKPQFHVRLRKESAYVRIEIEDNGPGIPDDVQRRIFEPFFTTKPIGVGTGLGLSVSYSIITQNHGGTFEVESQVADSSNHACGRTKFIIRLPI